MMEWEWRVRYVDGWRIMIQRFEDNRLGQVAHVHDDGGRTLLAIEWTDPGVDRVYLPNGPQVTINGTLWPIRKIEELPLHLWTPPAV